jgi:hypothetical protein
MRKIHQRKPERKTTGPRKRRSWVGDRFLFGMMLTLLGLVTVTLAITGRLFGDPALIGLAVLTVPPAFWLFYQRGRSLAGERPPAKPPTR